MAEEMLADPVEIDQPDGEQAESSEGESRESTGSGQESESDAAYTTKYSREMRAAIKALEAAHPESAKYLKQARDNHARLFALGQLEPKGIDGVRETYSLVNSLARGETKGIQALTAMQEDLATYEEGDELIARGDPKALDALGEDFNAGLAKLAPAYLERVLKTDPGAFQAAVNPYIVSTLANSDLVREYNALVDVLNSQGDPRFDDKTKMSFAIQQLGKMGKWLNELAAGATAAKPAPATQQETGQPDPQAQIEQERREIHWERNIYPAAGKAVEEKFNELLKPLQPRLKLTETQRRAAFEDFKAKNTKLCEADKAYGQQISFYRKQKNPDAGSVLNTVKAQLAKTAKNAFDQVKAERWEAFLAAKPKVGSPAQPANGKPAGPVPPNVEIRTVKPPMSEINHRATPIEWLAMRQYRLNSGKIIRVVPN